MSIRSKIFCSLFLLVLAGCQKQTESTQVATTSASAATTGMQAAAASTASSGQVAPQQKKRVWVQYPDPNTPLSPEASLGKQLFLTLPYLPPARCHVRPVMILITRMHLQITCRCN